MTKIFRCILCGEDLTEYLSRRESRPMCPGCGAQFNLMNFVESQREARIQHHSQIGCGGGALICIATVIGFALFARADAPVGPGMVIAMGAGLGFTVLYFLCCVCYAWWRRRD